MSDDNKVNYFSFLDHYNQSLIIEELFKDPIDPEQNPYFIENSIIRKPEIF